MSTLTPRVFQLLISILSSLFSLFVGLLMAGIVIISFKSTNQYGIPSSIALGLFSLLLISIGLVGFVVGIRNFLKNKDMSIQSTLSNTDIISNCKDSYLVAPINYMAHSQI